MMSTNRKDIVTKMIAASADKIYQAIIDPKALICWLPPKNMKGQVLRFEPWEGGAYQITLTYDDPEDQKKYGKSDGGDMSSGKFLRLVPDRLVKQSVEFESDDAAFSGTMTMTYELTAAENGTEVTVTAEHVPEGISQQDHLDGINSSLENLADYLQKMPDNLSQPLPAPEVINANGNPLLKHRYTADPTALVYKGRLYLVTGHDESPPGSSQYVMNDWLWFSSSDLIHWTDHGSLWKATDFEWASGDAYASKFIEKDGKFYFYAAVSHATVAGKGIGVAVADTPTGPFKDALGQALISQETIPPTDNEKANLDPSVLIDSDGQAYLFWGSKICYFAKLKSNMVELDGPVRTIPLPSFEEGAHIHMRNGWYYLCYGYEMPEKVAYAMSKSIEGPWEFKGMLNDTVENCETNRPCVVDFQGQSYFFYHNGALKDGGSQRRSVCVDRLHYNPDGTIEKVRMTSGGI